MTQPGRWENTLNNLGHFFDIADAHHFEIVEEPHSLSVSWQAGRERQRRSCFFQLKEISVSGTRIEPVEWWSWRALLSSLGHEIDRAQIDVTSIVEELGGITVSGSSRGMYVHRHFPYLELQGGRVYWSAGETRYSGRPRWVSVAGRVSNLLHGHSWQLDRAS